MYAHGTVPAMSSTGRRHVDLSRGDQMCDVAFLSSDGETKYYCGLPKGHAGTHEDAYGYEFPKDAPTFKVDVEALLKG